LRIAASENQIDFNTWNGVIDTDLLDLRLCDLNPDLSNTLLKPSINSLYKNLEDKGFIFFRPKIYVGDEWFSPEGTNYISVPFYLTSKKLIELERQKMNFVEGESVKSCGQLLRHEAGHCFDHAYGIAETSEWASIFGNPLARYSPDKYVANPHSKNFVINLEANYGQSHPYEDFAETFAVWLDPKSNWQKL